MVSTPNILANIYQAGNTVRLKCKFENMDDIKVNPDSVILTIYNYKYEELDVFELDESNRESDGEYFYYYTLPLNESRIIYEWKGILQGEEYTQRQSILTTFL